MTVHTVTASYGTQYHGGDSSASSAGVEYQAEDVSVSAHIQCSGTWC